ncbi:Protein kinase domain-containing protein [Psidium guajava]|nr:Protein kinase domain-containing protein [Psidium guajava]
MFGKQAWKQPILAELGLVHENDEGRPGNEEVADKSGRPFWTCLRIDNDADLDRRTTAKPFPCGLHHLLPLLCQKARNASHECDMPN